MFICNDSIHNMPGSEQTFKIKIHTLMVNYFNVNKLVMNRAKH